MCSVSKGGGGEGRGAQVWFQELHAALPAGHAEQLRALYVVHPKSHWAATRTWAFMLQGQESHFYGKVRSPH